MFSLAAVQRPVMAVASTSARHAIALPAVQRTFAVSAAVYQKPDQRKQQVPAAKPTPAQTQSQWDFLLGTMNQGRSTEAAGRAGRLDSAFASPIYNHLNSGKRLTKSQQIQAFESLWQENHTLPSLYKPAKPSEGRTVAFDRNTLDFSAAFGQLQGIMRRNKVRSELILGDRYEKPNQRRRRLASVRHRRRFADLVRQKVQLVRMLRTSPSTLTLTTSWNRSCISVLEGRRLDIPCT